jgi:O-antigen biosynthesis protein
MTRRGGGAVSVLMYHWVDPDPGRQLGFHGVRPETFAAQMARLARDGWSCLGLEELLAALQQARPLPRRSFVLTFDDGYADLEPYVLPVLERHGFRATVFVVTGHVGGTNVWDARHGDAPRRLLDWDALRRLDGGALRFESHSCSHPFLTEVPPERAAREVADSKRRLEDELGREVAAFAYPHGRFDLSVEASVREAGYRGAVTDIRGLNRRGTDPYRIRRAMMTSDDHLPGFLLKARTGHDLRSALRAAIGRATNAPPGVRMGGWS